MEWMLLPLKRYADFSGRSRRKEYWMFVLFTMVVITVLTVLTGLMFAGMAVSDSTGEPEMGALGFVALALPVLFVLGTFIPNLAVQVRRFHDQDKSGWMILLGVIPYIGAVILLVFMCLEGTRGANRYGPDPKNPDQSGVFD